MMNKKIAVLTLTGLLSACSLSLMAADKSSAGSAAPPTGIPGVNQAQGPESKYDKADKKGEEASGNNSGAESHETAKDAATSSDAKDAKKP